MRNFSITGALLAGEHVDIERAADPAPRQDHLSCSNPAARQYPQMAGKRPSNGRPTADIRPRRRLRQAMVSGKVAHRTRGLSLGGKDSAWVDLGQSPLAAS
jgi:hypothetical protein